MAPEQRLGLVVDARADVFGAGAVAYELVTGLAVDLDISSALARGVAGWPHLKRIRDVRREAPVELEAVIWRALAYQAAARHASCSELERELAVVMDAHGFAITDRDIGEWVSRELAHRMPVHTATYIAAGPSSPTPT
jgi:hypothetical protein